MYVQFVSKLNAQWFQFEIEHAKGVSNLKYAAMPLWNQMDSGSAQLTCSILHIITPLRGFRTHTHKYIVLFQDQTLWSIVRPKYPVLTSSWAHFPKNAKPQVATSCILQDPSRRHSEGLELKHCKLSLTRRRRHVPGQFSSMAWSLPKSCPSKCWNMLPK